MTFLTVWIAYAICGSIVFSAVFVWAVRARQFSNIDRARYIALRTSDESDPARGTPNRIDRWTWLIVLTLALTPVIVAVLMGIRAK